MRNILCSGLAAVSICTAAPKPAEAYADMVRSLEERHYTRVSRYTTSAFMRVKLGQALTRTVRPHIFESRADAQAFHDTVGEG